MLTQVPGDKKVAVVSVVGAFRTGKSFLLSWFLRYLEALSNGDVEREGVKKNTTSNDLEDEPVMVNEEDHKNGKQKLWYEKVETLGKKDGFSWAGGSERETTGIWIWSKPYYVTNRNETTGKDEQMAVLLVDTQGMFDHETTMALTASIFGMSTLLSSYQIYNVDKRIQEDNLQHLALFSEYGRVAIGKGPAEESVAAPSPTETSDGKTADETTAVADSEDPPKLLEEDEAASPKSKPEEPAIALKPFQRVEFLVRDWQNYEDDEDMDLMMKEMDEYLDSVLLDRTGAKDLQETREHIDETFEKVSCYLMTHPGFDVTKKKYTGQVSTVEPTFLKLLDKYCGRVFGANLAPKKIKNREVTAAELGTYIDAYAKLFASGAKFPEASTMLDATMAANNANAERIAIDKYKVEMDQIAGPNAISYVKPEEFNKHHRNFMRASISLHDDMADFGRKGAIEKSRQKVVGQIAEYYEIYSKLNEGRNPLAGFETFMIPIGIGACSFILRWFADNTCSSWSETCKSSSYLLSELYTVMFIFLLIVCATKVKLIREKVDKLIKIFGS